MFVLKGTLYFQVSPEYYMGKTYQYQHEIYPCVSYDINKAKLYKSRKIAERSCDILNDKISSEHTFEVVEVSEDIKYNKLSQEKINKINKLLVTIIQSKEDICEIVNKNCKICPLNIDDKCNELNLPEFDFKYYKWLDNLGEE